MTRAIIIPKDEQGVVTSGGSNVITVKDAALWSSLLAQAKSYGLLAVQAGSAQVYASWTDLAADTGSAGDAAIIFEDAGTHTDPVVGGTVQNAGIYRWSASPAGWERVASTEAARADAFASAAAVSAEDAETAKSDAEDARDAAVAAQEAAEDAQAAAEDAVTDAENMVQAVSDALAAGTISDLVGTRIYSSRSSLEADLDPADNLYALVVGDPTPANNDLYQKNGATTTGSWDGPLGIFAAASAMAQAAADDATASAAAVATNFAPDPTFRTIGRNRPFPSQWASVAPYGTQTEFDADNPFGGGAAISAAGLLRWLDPISDLPFEGGDVIRVRLLLKTDGASTSVSIDFRDNGNVSLDTEDWAVGIGTHDEIRTVTIPSGTTYIMFNIYGGAGDKTVKLLARAMSYDPVTPQFAEAGALIDRRRVYAQAAQRRLVLMGDSIIADSVDVSAEPDNYLHTLLSAKLDAIVTNCGFGGTTMALRSDANYSAFSMSALATAIASNTWTAQDAAAATLTGFAAALARLKAVNWANTYGLIVGHGTNDFAAEQKAMGSDTDSTGATFKGAINQVIADILGAYPHLKLLFLTPTYRDRFAGKGSGTASTSGTTLTLATFAGDPVAVGDSIYIDGVTKRTKIASFGSGSGATGTYNLDRSAGTLTTRDIAIADASTNSDSTSNNLGLKLGDYADAIISRCAANHVPVLDAFRESGINAATATRRLQDGLHPSPKIGLYELADFIAQRGAGLLV